jgi:cytochrome P450
MTMEERARQVGCPIIDFDIEDGKGFRDDVYGMFDLARENGPFFYSTAARGFWVMSHLELITKAHLRPDLFSNQALEVFLRDSHVFSDMIPETLDPPQHMKFRGPLMNLFTPAAVKKYEDTFRALCISYLDRILGRDHCDFMIEVGRPLPADFFLGLLGIDQERRGPMTDALIGATFTIKSDDPTGEIRQKNAAIVIEELKNLMARLRKNPDGGLLSTVMERQVEGAPMNDDEVFSIALLLANAGVETTGGALGYIFHYLATHPEHRDEIAIHPSKIPVAIEELLRRFPVANNNRVIMKDEDFHGMPLRKGDRVVSALIAANRDPTLMPNGGEMLLDRSPNRHAVFGVGPHHCLGAHIARLEIRITLEEWHKRFPRYSLSPEFVPHHHAGSTISITSVPLIIG